MPVRQERGRAMQRLRKIVAQFLRQCRDGAERSPRASEAMIKRLCLQTAGCRFIREHNVESMGLQLVNERPKLALAADDMDRVSVSKCGPENLEGDQLRNRIGDSNVEAHWPLAGSFLNRAH